MRARDVAATCTSVVRVYRTATGEVHALKGVDAVFITGSVTAVVGPSGSGKSSLLRILAGLDRPTAGKVVVGGEDLGDLPPRRLHRLRREKVSYVFQRPQDNLVPYLDADQHVAEAARVRGDERFDPAGLLAGLGLAGRRRHRPSQLSGGEQQRLAFAQAVVGDPLLVLADEPTAELDHRTGADVLHHVRRLADDGIAFVVATHDPQVVAAADAVIELWHGAVMRETHGAGSFSVIDNAGRIQLSEEQLALFPDRRAVLRYEDGEVRLTPP